MEVLVPQGIVRSVSGQNCPDGVCEEVINARYRNGSWRVVGKKEVVARGVDYEQVYVHKYGTFENYIGVRDGLVVWFDPVTKGERQEVFHVSGVVKFVQINNLLICRDDVSIVKSVFVENRYDAAVLSIPDAPTLYFTTSEDDGGIGLMTGESGYGDGVFSILVGKGGVDCGDDVNDEYGDTTEFERPYYNPNYLSLHFTDAEIKSFNGVLQGLYNDMVDVDDYHTAGFVFISYAYQLYDGSVTKMAPFRLFKLGDGYKRGIIKVHMLDIINYAEDGILRDRDLQVKCLFDSMLVQKLNISFRDLPDYEQYKNIISKINVYASRPISVYDFEHMDCTYYSPPLC